MVDETNSQLNMQSEQQSAIISDPSVATNGLPETERQNPFERDPIMHEISASIFEFGKDKLQDPDIQTTIQDRQGHKFDVEGASVIDIVKEPSEATASMTFETILSQDEIDENLEAKNPVEIIEPLEDSPESNKQNKKYRVRIAIAVSLSAMLTATIVAKRHLDKKV
jgi:hypothetical protein